MKYYIILKVHTLSLWFQNMCTSLNGSIAYKRSAHTVHICACAHTNNQKYIFFFFFCSLKGTVHIRRMNDVNGFIDIQYSKFTNAIALAKNLKRIETNRCRNSLEKKNT